MANQFKFQKTAISSFLENLKIPAKPKNEQINHEDEMTETAALELEADENEQYENEAGWLIEMLWTDVDRRQTLLPIFGGDVRKEQASIVKTIGVRMREARELTNTTQSTAAKRLGYQNSSKLARVELASDGHSVPLWLIARAASLYDVSIDYLFGLTEDFDSTARRPAGEWLASALEKSRLRDLELIGRMHGEVHLVSKSIPLLLERAREAEAAINSFREINPDFDDARGGARVLGTVERLLSSALEAMSGLRRLDSRMGLPAR